MWLECCDNDLLGSGRCSTCPHINSCVDTKKDEITEAFQAQISNKSKSRDIDNWDDL